MIARELIRTRPDLISPSGEVKVWFIQPLGLMTFTEGHFSTEDARFVVDRAWPRLEGFTRAVGFDGFRFVHHWAGMTSYDKEARQILVEWGRRIRSDIKDVTVILAPNTRPMIKMGAQVGTTLLNMVGVTMVVEYHFPDVVDRLGLGLLRAA